MSHRRSRVRSLLAVLAGPLLVWACGCREEEKTMLFHAGVGQRSSLDEIQELFCQRHPDVKVNFSYKGSGYFIADITRSQEGDLYMPGEEFYLLQAVERGFITDYQPDRDIAACFVTVIITPRGNPKGIQKVEDFTKPGVRVGLGNPKACAIGLWQEKTFQKAGNWDAVQKNATFSAKCIPELGNAAQHNLIDATIVWATTAVLYLRDVEIVPIEPKYRGVVRLPVAVLGLAGERGEGRQGRIARCRRSECRAAHQGGRPAAQDHASRQLRRDRDEAAILSRGAKVEFLLGQGVGPFWHLNGVERACPPMMGPRQWEELVLPYDGEIMRLIKERDPDGLIHVHCHGKVGRLLPLFLAMGVDSTDPVEPPPQGDITFRDARRLVGDRMTLYGNIEFLDMERRTPGEVEEKVRAAIEEGGRERTVLYPSAPPHQQHTARFTANAIRYIEAGLKYGAR